jgi:hypothetical protein
VPLRKALIALALVAFLTAPAVAWAQPQRALGRHEGDGTLSVLRGRGTVDLQATGSVIGKIRKGRLRVKTTRVKRHGKGHGKVTIRMRKGIVRHRPDGTVVYIGKNIHFRIVDQKFRLRINGGGINLSAVAQGTCALQASLLALDPGLFSLNGGEYQPLPDALTTYQLTSSQ